MFQVTKARLQRAGGSFAYRDFRYFYAAVVSASMGNQIQRIVDLWLVYELTDSPAFLGLTGLARGIPIVVFSLGGGIIADRIDRKKFIMAMQLASAAANLLLAVLIAADAVRLWHILLISMVSSAFVAISAPARTAMTPNLVPRELLINAFAFTSTAWKLAQLVGPAVAGVMIGVAGTSATYGFNGCVYLVSALVLMFVNYRAAYTGTAQSAWRSLVEALSFVRVKSIIAVLVAMDVVAVYFGSFRVLLPIIAASFGMGAAGFGLFSSAPAVGALVGAAAMIGVGDVRYKGLVVVGGILAYAACLAGLALSPWFWTSFVMVALLGFFDAMQAIPRNTVIQAVTPDALRGRVSSFTRMLSVGMPGLGEAQTGLVASVVGSAATLMLGAVVCAGATLGMLAWRHDLRRADL
ncbi:MAG: MFS transporter [Deltaproteobacteria bacterium]|nr:MFS transporter [Deltaproteobacteria bacterium]